MINQGPDNGISRRLSLNKSVSHQSFRYKDFKVLQTSKKSVAKVEVTKVNAYDDTTCLSHTQVSSSIKIFIIQRMYYTRPEFSIIWVY